MENVAFAKGVKLKKTVIDKKIRGLRRDAWGDFHFNLSMNWSFPNIITCDSDKITLLHIKKQWKAEHLREVLMELTDFEFIPFKSFLSLAI